jgi:N-acetylmuramoyl-L-alanine amidase
MGLRVDKTIPPSRCMSVLAGLLSASMIIGLLSVGREGLAATRGSLLKSSIDSSVQANRSKAPSDPSRSWIANLRVGTHPGFTRVVIELTGAQEWSLEHGGADIRVIVPGVGIDESIRRIDYSRGIVRSVQPVRRAGGVEVLIVCESASARIRKLTLTNPDRIVLDVLSPNAEGGLQASPQPEPATRPTASTLRGGNGAPDRAPARPGSSPQGSASLPHARNTPQPAPTPPASGKDQGKGVQRAGEEKRDEEAPPLTIVLDPGHGGHDTGAIGPSGLMEKDVALDLAVRLRKLLRDRLGVRVLMTRSEDVFVPLPERSAFANGAKADFMISLHVNAANARGAVGFETFYFTREPSDNDARASAQRENLVIENNGSAGKDLESLLKATLADMAVTRDMKESSRLAEGILAALDKILRVDNRGVKSGPFYVLATAAMPAVLVESAFITNPKEERRLQREDYRQRIAEGLYEGIAAYKVRYEQRLGLRAVPVGVRS